MGSDRESRRMITEVRRFAALGILVVTLGASAALAVPADAAGTAHFSGAAPGMVRCTNVALTFKYANPSTATSRVNTVRYTGLLSGCTVSNAPAGVAVTITRGKVKGSAFLGSGCAGLTPIHTNPDSNPEFVGTITWKGTYADATHSGKAAFAKTVYNARGFLPVTDGSGHAGLETPDPAHAGSSSSQGSFRSTVGFDEDFLYTSQSAAVLEAQCQSAHGLKKLSITHGLVTIP